MSTTLTDPNKIKQAKIMIITASIAVPLVVVVLFGVKLNVEPLTFLPPVYASINALTALILIVALWAIRSGKKELHRSLMRLALLCSLLFLAGYVAYHMTSEPTIYGDSDHNKELSLEEIKAVQGSALYYYILLFSHILLSVFIIPLVLFSYFHAWKGDFVKHKKWTRIAFPMWLYVAISGVVVYLMISPYYG
jgi:putative membrane protein